MSNTKNVLHVALVLTINSQTIVSKLVPHWQVPAYEAKFGENLALDRDSANQVRPCVIDDQAIKDEMSVMTEAIGRNESGQPWWEVAYGNGIGGRKALAAAMLSEPTEYTLNRDEDLVGVDLAAEVAKDQEIKALKQKLAAYEAAQASREEPSGDGGNGDPLADAGKGKAAGKPKG